MDGRRITASPRPCNGRRAVAKKRRRDGGDGFVNSFKKLQSREICSKKDRGFRTSDAQERFRNIRLQVQFCFLNYVILFLVCRRFNLVCWCGAGGLCRGGVLIIGSEVVVIEW
ncbi:hypothetical protein Hanom_Chr07g00597761 [Helianthus anomalus]